MHPDHDCLRRRSRFDCRLQCPLGGTLFTLEVLLGSFSLPASVAALATCVIATLVAWLGLGNGLQYSVPPLAISSSIIGWSLLAGPVLGVAAYLFVKATEAARVRAPKDWRLVVWCSLVFPIIGLLAIPFPQLLGNGKGVAQAGFDNEVGLTLAAILLLLRVVVIVASLRAGAAGGLLTPGLSIGALLGIILGTFWNHIWPTGSLADFAVVGGAAFPGGIHENASYRYCAHSRIHRYWSKIPGSTFARGRWFDVDLLPLPGLRRSANASASSNKGSEALA
jgi:H+/Cl- antiporter ClcA